MKASGRRRAAVRSGIARKRSILETDWAADLPMTRISSVCSCYERAKGQTLRGRWPVSGRDELGLDTGLWGFAPPPGFSAPIHLARILLLESGEDPPPLCNRQPFSLRASLSPRMKFPWISLERSYRSSIYSKPCFCSSPLRTRLPRSNLSSVFREESINFF